MAGAEPSSPICVPRATNSTPWSRRLPDADWPTPTPAPGWTIAHQIAHLLWTDRVACIAVTDEAGFADVLGGGDRSRRVRRRGRRGAGRDAARRAAGRLAARPARACTTRCWRVADGRKLPWFGPPMSAASMATARLMETWAHGLDVADALGVERPATARLRSIAHIGVRTRDFAFAVHGLAAPGRTVSRRADAPRTASTWSWGPDDAASA